LAQFLPKDNKSDHNFYEITLLISQPVTKTVLSSLDNCFR